ncbi:LicD family protein [Sphingobacterium thalpophilum]|uniref:LicD family protein n=1 Tax=Sphingobacterium thalpophilum TaxID=259 RepID=UPI003D9971B0
MKKYKIDPVLNRRNENSLQKYHLRLARYIEKYGFGLSESEINEIYQHIEALEDFLSSEEEYALIYSNVQKPEIIYEFDISEDDWNFITLEQGTYFKYLPQQGYRLGYKWSDMNYLITREGAAIILERIKEIDQPYCDIILELIGKKKLTDFVLNDDAFQLTRQTKGYDESRNQEILSTIFKKDRWNIHDKTKVRELLQIVFFTSKELGIDLFINEGTLLGCIRHGEIMKWDDDLDVAVNSKDVRIFLNKLKQNKNLDMGTAYLRGRHLFYKIWLRDCKEIQGHKHRFPFIDIWPFEVVESCIHYDFGYTYPIEDIFPLSDRYFEETVVKVPQNPLSYLDNRYPGWKDKIVFYPYCHRDERSSEKQLEAYISVDSHGLMQYDCMEKYQSESKK